MLAEPDAVAFLLEAARNRTPAADEAEHAKLVACDVPGLALALTQAAGFIDKYRITFAEYRKRWHANIAAVTAWHDPKTMSYGPCSRNSVSFFFLFRQIFSLERRITMRYHGWQTPPGVPHVVERSLR